MNNKKSTVRNIIVNHTVSVNWTSSAVAKGYYLLKCLSAPQIQLWCWHCAPYKCSYYYYYYKNDDQ